MAHPVGNGVIGAGGVVADTEAADHLPALIERNAAAESDDAAWHEPDARALRLEGRVKTGSSCSGHRANRRAVSAHYRLAVERARPLLLKPLVVVAMAMAMARLPGHGSTPALITEQSFP